MNDFLNMGGYALYVWPSFGLYVGLLVWLGVGSLRHHRRALIRAQQRRNTA